MTRVAPPIPRTVGFQKKKRIRDRKYLDTFRYRACEVCGWRDQDDVVACHVRFGHEGATGQKPDDSMVVALCAKHHAEQEANPGALWWFENVFKRWVRRNYATWKAGK